MYSPNTIEKCKNCLPNLKFFWLSAVSDSADENTFLDIFAKLKPNLKIV